MPCAAAGPGPGDDAAVGVDHNRGEKKFPYAKSRLTTVLGGMENVQLMTIPQRLRNQLVTLASEPDTRALNLMYVFGSALSRVSTKSGAYASGGLLGNLHVHSLGDHVSVRRRVRRRYVDILGIRRET